LPELLERDGSSETPGEIARVIELAQFAARG
jgi:hypothetical protein